MFAAGYSACFLGALKFVAGKQKLALPAESSITGNVGIGPIPTGFALKVQLDINVPGLPKEQVQQLVEAAHILPVGSPESADHVTNGIALSPTYHRAFDAGLIYLDEHYQMRLNTGRMTEITALGRGGGLEGFRSALGRIFLPPDRAQWPHRDFIRRANRYRRVT